MCNPLKKAVVAHDAMEATSYFQMTASIIIEFLIKIQCMKYENICKGNFIARPNRFIAEVLTDGKKKRPTLKNTGRCREL